MSNGRQITFTVQSATPDSLPAQGPSDDPIPLAAPVRLAGRESAINLLVREDGTDQQLLSLCARAVRSLLAPSLPASLRRQLTARAFDPPVELENPKPVLEIEAPPVHSEEQLQGAARPHSSRSTQTSRSPQGGATPIRSPQRTLVDALRLAQPLARTLLPQLALSCPRGCGMLEPTSPALVAAAIAALREPARARVLLGVSYPLGEGPRSELSGRPVGESRTDERTSGRSAAAKDTPGARTAHIAPAEARAQSAIERALLLVESYRARGTRRFSFNGVLFAIDPAADVGAVRAQLAALSARAPSASSPPASSRAGLPTTTVTAPPAPSLTVYQESFTVPLEQPAELHEAAARTLKEAPHETVLDLIGADAKWDGTSHPLRRYLVGAGYRCPHCSFQRDPVTVEELRLLLSAPPDERGALYHAGENTVQELLNAPLGSLRSLPLLSDAAPGSEAIRSAIERASAAGLALVPLGRPVPSLSQGEQLKLSLLTLAIDGVSGSIILLPRLSEILHPTESVDALAEVFRAFAERGNAVFAGELAFPEPWVAFPDLTLLSEGASPRVTAGRAENPDPPAPSTKKKGAKNPPAKRALAKRSPPDAAAADSTAGARRKGGGRTLLLPLPNGATHEIPRGTLVALVGPSGSGKTRLLEQLYRIGRGNRREAVELTLADRVHLALGAPAPRRTNRLGPPSTVAAALGVAPLLGRYFAGTKRARALGLPDTAFMLEQGTARCIRCDGYGTMLTNLEFAGRLLERCDRCGGDRFESDPLTVVVRDHTIAQLLAFSAETAAQHFASEREIVARVMPLVDLGCGEIRLNTELRELDPKRRALLQLARHLQQVEPPHSLVLGDQLLASLPQRARDRALATLHRHATAGGTVVIITHDPAVCRAADHTILLERDGGARPLTPTSGDFLAPYFAADQRN